MKKWLTVIAALLLSLVLCVSGLAEGTAEAGETLEGAAAAAAVETIEETIAAPTEIATWFVCVMGISIVFIGLICLIVLISAMGAIMKRVNARKEEKAQPQPAAPVAEAIPNRAELVAAVSVALAEELGKDVRAICIHSIKRV